MGFWLFLMELTIRTSLLAQFVILMLRDRIDAKRCLDKTIVVSEHGLNRMAEMRSMITDVV